MRYATYLERTGVLDALVPLAAIFCRDARLALSQPVGFIGRWFSPVIAIAGFYFVARFVDPHHSLPIDGRHVGYFAYVSVNLSFMLLLTSALQSLPQTIRYDQLVGTLEPIMATRAPARLVIGGCVLWPLGVSLTQVAFSLGIASLIMGLDLRATDVVSLLAFVVLSLLTMSAIGIIGAAAVVAFKQMPPSGYLVGGAASLLAGTLFPIRLLPPVLQLVSWCLPLTHALRGLRGAIAGDPVFVIAGDALWLAIAAALLLPFSCIVFASAVRRARSDGTLAHY
jgi:ABC-type multidrug transport system permease subunit